MNNIYNLLESDKKVILSLSGGLDSTTLLAHLINKGVKVFPVFFNYGSKHNQYEMQSIEKIFDYYQLNNSQIIHLPYMHKFKSNLLLNQEEIPEGHYNDLNMAKTIVPYRNLIFISILAGIAASNDCQRIALAVHQGDHFIYPDCRPDFIRSVNESIALGFEPPVSLYTPFINKSKSDIVNEGLKLQVPYNLTRTCYKNQETACGKCGSCFERLEAFQLNNTIDPIYYDSYNTTELEIENENI